MKFPYPTLARLMSGRSAIVETGDGELTIPPVLQPVTEIFSPIISLSIVPPLSQDTWLSNINLSAIGATAAQTGALPTFASGRWDLDISFCCTFSGTSDFNKSASVLLSDPDGNNISIFNRPYSNAGPTFGQSLTMRLLFNRPGWYVSVSTSAILALESTNAFVSVYARRVF